MLRCSEIADGKGPIAAQRVISKSITLDELWEKWKTEHATPRLRNRTIVTDQSRFDTCFDDWRSRRIGTVRESDVRAKHAEPPVRVEPFDVTPAQPKPAL